jgi:hypothetical protein
MDCKEIKAASDSRLGFEIQMSQSWMVIPRKYDHHSGDFLMFWSMFNGYTGYTPPQPDVFVRLRQDV